MIGVIDTTYDQADEIDNIDAPFQKNHIKLYIQYTFSFFVIIITKKPPVVAQAYPVNNQNSNGIFNFFFNFDFR